MKAWAAVVAVLAAGLLLLAAFVGTRPTSQQVVDVLPVVGDPIEATLHRPVVAAFLAAMLLVLLIGAIRGARLRWLAYAPGPVDVADLKVAGSVPNGVAERLTLHFRQRLADLHLATPGPQPGVAAATSFVDLIGSATHDSKNLLATVAGLLRVAWPSQAYQMQATLVQDAEQGFGVSVHVVMLPATTTPPTTCWAASWEMAIDGAANRAAAFILTRTRVCRRSPWVAWQGYVLPPRLLEAYERAAVCTHERRYDEALREYYTALELDPKNLELRLRIGFIQEKLGLALDALTTYQATYDLNCECLTPGVGRATARAVAKARKRSQAIASYRRAVLLGSADAVSEQWCAPDAADGRTRRDEQRCACRARLWPTLMELCQHKWSETVAHHWGLTLKELLTGDADTADRETLLRKVFQCADRETLLREVFQCAALEALEELAKDLPWKPRGGDERSLTRTAITLSEHCVELRLRSTRRQLKSTATSERLEQATLQGWVRRAGLQANATWSERLTLSSLRTWVRRAVLRRNVTWSERYCAASLFALAISCDVDADKTVLAEKKRAALLAEEAVYHLERAIERAESGYVASRRAWLVSEDPDFNSLRPIARFQRFEAMYFPSHHPMVARQPASHRWELIEYVHQLIAACAEHRQNEWQAQLLATNREGEPQEQTSLWHEELQAWELVAEVASNCEHWQTRLKLLEALRMWTAQTDGGTPLGYPDYGRVAPDPDESDAVINGASDRLAAVHVLAERQRAGLAGFASAPAGRDRITSSEPRGRRSRAVQRERIAAWQTLSDTLALASGSTAATNPQPDDAVAVLNGAHRRRLRRPRAGADRSASR
jgi:tetratricopeptide (TPR) repeat protein